MPGADEREFDCLLNPVAMVAHVSLLSVESSRNNAVVTQPGATAFFDASSARCGLRGL